MADDDDDESDDGPAEDEVREALRALKTGTEASRDHVLTLWNASSQYEVKLLPEGAIDAIFTMLETRRDVNNGGMDQVVWNHGAEASRSYATYFRTVGMIENADLLDRLIGVLEEHDAKRSEGEVAKDPIKYFMEFRKAVGGPAFNIPDPAHEMDEPLLEYVLEHASEMPDPDGELPLKKPES